MKEENRMNERNTRRKARKKNKKKVAYLPHLPQAHALCFQTRKKIGKMSGSHGRD
jgi:hypothetical protein